MNEILNKLLDNQLLSQENRDAIAESINTFINEWKSQQEEIITKNLVESLTKQFNEEKTNYFKTLESKTQKVLESTTQQFANEILSYKDQEIEAKRAVAQEIMSLRENYNAEKANLSTHMASILTKYANEAFETLKEDISVIRKQTFGLALFEHFADEYNKSFHDKSSVRNKLDDTMSDLEAANALIASLQCENQKLQRNNLIAESTKNLKGKAKTELTLILENTSTDKIPTIAEQYIKKIVNPVATKSQTTQITEGALPNKSNIVTNSINKSNNNVNSNNDNNNTVVTINDLCLD